MRLLALAAVLARPAHLPLADIAPGSLRTLDALRLEIVLVQQGLYLAKVTRQVAYVCR